MVNGLNQEKNCYEQQECQEKAIGNIMGIFDDFHKSGDTSSTLSTHCAIDNYQVFVNDDEISMS